MPGNRPRPEPTATDNNCTPFLIFRYHWKRYTGDNEQHPKRIRTDFCWCDEEIHPHGCPNAYYRYRRPSYIKY